MEDKIKEIVSVFTKIPVAQIGPGTAVDRTVLQSSILLHRMYAKLAEEGVTVENYTEIRTFGDLISLRVDLSLPGADLSDSSGGGFPEGQMGMRGLVSGDDPAGGIGIDIEEIASLPRTYDFRGESFYKMNFAPEEIAYCVLQPDPYASFAGLFAAKEAIIKADGQYRNQVFHSILIRHSPEGKPLFPGLELSISHSGTMAVAVAAITRGSQAEDPAQATPGQIITTPDGNIRIVLGLAGLALAISVIALIFVLTHWHE